MVHYVRYVDDRHGPLQQNLVVFIYLLVFVYIYLTVRSMKSVKSKYGLGCAAVAIVFASMAMALGICTYGGLPTALVGEEVVPFLIVAMGLESMTTITMCVGITSWDVPVRFRIAEGVGRAGPTLSKSVLQLEICLLIGVYSRIPPLKEFCVIASVCRRSLTWLPPFPVSRMCVRARGGHVRASAGAGACYWLTRACACVRREGVSVSCTLARAG
jgi:hypothetical protein